MKSFSKFTFNCTFTTFLLSLFATLNSWSAPPQDKNFVLGAALGLQKIKNYDDGLAYGISADYRFTPQFSLGGSYNMQGSAPESRSALDGDCGPGCRLTSLNIEEFALNAKYRLDETLDGLWVGASAEAMIINNTYFIFGPAAGWDWTFAPAFSVGLDANYMFVPRGSGTGSLKGLIVLRAWL